MASKVGKAKCVLWFHESRSAVTVQWRFRTVFGREPPTKMSIYKWCKLFDHTARIYKGRSHGRRPVTEAQVDTVPAAFVRIPLKSTGHAARQLTTVQKILRKHLKFRTYKYLLLQHVTDQDKKFATHFALIFF
jgi:hypothetical protein